MKNVIKCFKVLGTFALGATLLTVLPAFGDTVEYTTSGVFSASNSNVVDGTNGSTITFNAVPNMLTSPLGNGNTPFADSLGYFEVSTTVPGQTLTGSGTFTLTIDQIMPGGTSGSFTPAAFSGTITTDGTGIPTGDLGLVFSQTNITIDGINYALQNLTNGNTLVIGTTSTNVQAEITGTAAPEPLSLSLLGGGLALTGLLRLRRKAALK